MVNTSGAAVFPKKAFLFVPKCHLLRFGKLNAFTAQMRENEIDFIYGEKFYSMLLLFQLFTFLHYSVKYMWARLYRKKPSFMYQSVTYYVLEI